MVKAQMCLYINIRAKRMIKKIAEFDGVSQTQLIRTALDFYIEHRKTHDPINGDKK